MNLNRQVDQANKRLSRRRQTLARLTTTSVDAAARRSLFWALLSGAFASGFLAQRLSPARPFPRSVLRFLRSALIPGLPF